MNSMKGKIMFKNVLSLMALNLVVGCSVYKASQNEGISLSDVKKCQLRGCYISNGMEIMDRHTEDNGQYTEIYRAKARKTGVNYARAAGHGVLDVMTLGLWEVAGTPIEGAISNNRGYITVQATYASKASDQVLNARYFDAYGKEVNLHKKKK